MSQVKVTADSGGGTVSLKAPATTTSNAAVVLTLPVDDGAANTFLKSNGSGVTSWASPTATEIGTTSGTASASTYLCGNNTWGTPSGGKILQVVEAIKKDTATNTSSSWADISGLSVSITPSSTSSKILVQANIQLAANGSNCHMALKLIRDSTDFNIGDADSSANRASYGGFLDSNAVMVNATLSGLDSPSSTSSLAYKVQGRVTHDAGSDAFAINMNPAYNNGNLYFNKCVSNIIVMEVGA